MKKKTIYKISRNIYLIEKYFKDKEQFGFIELFENGKIEISVKKNAEPWIKVLGLHHELSHLSQFITEEIIELHKNESVRIKKFEKLSDLCANIVAWIINHVDWYAKGVEQLKQKEKRINDI